MCCPRITVTLDGIVEEKESNKAGTYQKANGSINNRSHWNQIDGDQALWYTITFNKWKIGPASNLGSDTGNINSVQDTACPTTNDLFKYWDGDEWTLESSNNSVSIQCV